MLELSFTEEAHRALVDGYIPKSACPNEMCSDKPSYRFSGVVLVHPRAGVSNLPCAPARLAAAAPVVAGHWPLSLGSHSPGLLGHCRLDGAAEHWIPAP